MTCKSCGSDRCGNQAACARRWKAAHDRWFCWWLIGAVETAFVKLRTDPRVSILAPMTALMDDRQARMFCLDVMQRELKRSGDG